MLGSATDWASLEIAGAFCIGAIVATIAVIRLLDFLKDRDRS